MSPASKKQTVSLDVAISSCKEKEAGNMCCAEAASDRMAALNNSENRIPSVQLLLGEAGVGDLARSDTRFQN